jgi:hypothetical protein
MVVDDPKRPQNAADLGWCLLLQYAVLHKLLGKQLQGRPNCSPLVCCGN